MKKISVLIPTYNRPEFLKQALESVLNQTKLPDEIIICDDNNESDINYETIKGYLRKFPFIKYIKNKNNLGAAENYKNLFFLSKGKYIKWLADDDILLPTALEKMSYYLDKFPNVKLVTSYRQLVDERLHTIERFPVSYKRIFTEDTIVKGIDFCKKSLIDMNNYIGEFSAVMFRKEDVDFKLFELNQRKFIANSDWLTWLMLSKKGDIAYISEPLVKIRQSYTQDQLNINTILSGAKELYVILTNKDFDKDFRITSEEKKTQIKNLLNKYLSKRIFIKRNEEKNSFVIEDLIEKTINFYEKNFSNNKEKRENFSIISVTYNSEKTLIPFINSVIRSMEKNDEFIIVDNNSKDRTKEILKEISKKHKNVKVIFSKENLGYSKGINVGIENSSNPYLVFINPDTEVPKNWLENIFYHLKDTKVGGVSVLSTYVIPTHNILKYFNIALLQDINTDTKSKIVSILREKENVDTKLLIGFCFATKREILDQIGYLDEELFLGNDDLELSWRLREHGYKLKIALDTFVHHEGHVSFKTEKKSKTEKLVQESTNKLADKLIKHYGYGNVPHPTELWGIGWFTPFGEKYKYMFKINNKKANVLSINTNSEKKVSVVLVNYKNSQDTLECINSLLKQSYTNISVLVVDNSEEEHYFEKLLKDLEKSNIKVLKYIEGENVRLKFSKDVHVIKARENRGFSAGNNIGISVALQNNTDFVWILNNDTVVLENTIKEMIEVSRIYDVSVITCKIKDYFQRNKVQYDGEKVYIEPIEEKNDILKPPAFLSGANIFIKKDVFEKVGLLDEDFFLYFEDNEFHHRLLKNSIDILYTPYTWIYHRGSSSTGGYLKNPFSMYYFTRNHFLLFRKIEKNQFSKALDTAKFYYENTYKDKKLLKAIILGIYDFVDGKVGRREDLLELINAKEKPKIRKSLEDLTYEELFELSFYNPRKKEYFRKFLQKTEELL